MSALLPHIKSHRALAKALSARADAAGGQTEASLLNGMSIAFFDAADDLEQQMKAEATGEMAPIAPPRRKAG